MEAEIILPGRPITKKNSQQITSPVEGGYSPPIQGDRISVEQYRELTSKGPRRYVVQSPQYQQYEEACLWELSTYRGSQFSTNVILEAFYYMKDRRGWPDLLGLLQGTCDILEKAKIIENDRLVVGFGKSRIVGIDRDNPRAEIVIREVEYEFEEVG